jgi:putative ABC transport system ATP-binding protein
MRSKYLGFIFQDFNLLPVLSAVENVELPLLLLGYGANDARKRALGALKDVGLEERSQHRPAELSGGQQQRVAVARAIVHRPSVILCDEPTGNLDSKTSGEVLTLLKRLNAEQNTTFLIVTHDAKIASLCDRVIQMDDGLIINSDAQHEEE